MSLIRSSSMALAKTLGSSLSKAFKEAFLGGTYGGLFATMKGSSTTSSFSEPSSLSSESWTLLHTQPSMDTTMYYHFVLPMGHRKPGPSTEGSWDWQQTWVGLRSNWGTAVLHSATKTTMHSESNHRFGRRHQPPQVRQIILKINIISRYFGYEIVTYPKKNRPDALGPKPRSQKGRKVSFGSCLEKIHFSCHIVTRQLSLELRNSCISREKEQRVCERPLGKLPSRTLERGKATNLTSQATTAEVGRDTTSTELEDLRGERASEWMDLEATCCRLRMK